MRIASVVFVALMAAMVLLAGCSQKEQLPTEKNIAGLDAQVADNAQTEQVLNEQNSDIGSDLEQVANPVDDVQAAVPQTELNSISTGTADAQTEQDIYDSLSTDIDTTI